MQYADKVNCKSEVFQRVFCLGFFLLMPMWCMMKCRVSLLKSSILLNALSNIGERVLSKEKQCASLQLIRNSLCQVSSPPKRESCLEKCKSLRTAKVLGGVGSLLH